MQSNEGGPDNATLQRMGTRVDELWEFSTNQLRSIALCHSVGYTLLLFTILDLITLVIPPQFTNAAWEFQTIGGIVERMPVPILGLGLIFFGGKKVRAAWENGLLKIVSWLTLVVGILMLLLIPLGILNTIRIDRQTTEQFTTQLEQQQTQLEQVQEAIAAADSPEALQTLIRQFGSSGNAPDIAPDQVEVMKEQLTGSMGQIETGTQERAAQARNQQRLTLMKNSVKWNLGALVSGVFLMVTWKLTQWSRQ